MTDLFGWFFGLLPRLLGAAIIVVVGAMITLVPSVLLYMLWRRHADKYSRAIGAVVSTVFWTWVVLCGLVIMSLGVNTLGIELI